MSFAAARTIVILAVLAPAGAPWVQAAEQARPIPVPPAKAPMVTPNPPRLAPAKKGDRWVTKAEVSYVSTGGNSDTTTAKLGSEVQYKPDDWTLFLRAAFLTSDNDLEARRHRVDGLLRASRSVSPRLELFGQLMYLRNTFAGINHSLYPLGGLAYALVEASPHSLKTRVGLGYGQENRLRQPSLSFATADAETAYRWTFSKTAELREDITFTTNLQRGTDWRVANVASVAASLSPLLSLKVSHSLNYLNEPVRGYERVDTVTAAALVATF
jgi:putative salt-induced outer membrane protein YdiY